MEKRKRSRKPTGRPRGRPRKSDKPVPVDAAGASSAPAPAPADVERMIAQATAAPAPDADAALAALATDIERDARTTAPALSGPVRGPSRENDKAVEQLSQQIAGLSVVLFGLLALWRGNEWAISEDEAGLIGDATAEPYADDAAELARQVKWVGPVTALVGIVGRKVVAEIERKRATANDAPRAPGTAPASNG